LSTGACIGHVGPEALAGGPIGKVRDGDLIEIVIDRRTLEGSVNLVGADGTLLAPDEIDRTLRERPPHPDLAPHVKLPTTRALGGTQSEQRRDVGRCVYGVDLIVGRSSAPGRPTTDDRRGRALP
jgi:dihydroxyacid dehydratase/phosphogluconate dehydratase